MTGDPAERARRVPGPGAVPASRLLCGSSWRPREAGTGPATRRAGLEQGEEVGLWFPYQ